MSYHLKEINFLKNVRFLPLPLLNCAETLIFRNLVSLGIWKASLVVKLHKVFIKLLKYLMIFL